MAAMDRRKQQKIEECKLLYGTSRERPVLLTTGEEVAHPPASEAFNPAFGYSAPHPSTGGTSTLLINALLSAHHDPM